MARRDLRSNALDAMMGGAPARPTKAPPTPDEAATTAAAPPSAESEASPTPKAKGTNRPARSRPTKHEKATERTTDGAASLPAADGYVGRSRYKRKKRGVVAKLAVHLSPDVADALRRAGAVGDENGSNMSEIVEALLRRAGYGEKGGG